MARGDDTRARLRETALAVWAEDGLESTVNRIIDRAGLKNPSAVRFHFGGREGLIDNIVDDYAGRLDATAAANLESVDRADSRALVAAIVSPYLDLLHGSDADRNYLRFVAQLISRPGRDLTGWGARTPVTVEILLGIAAADGETPGAIVAHRVYAAATLLVHLMASRVTALNPGLPDAVFAECVVDDVLNTLAAPLGAATAVALSDHLPRERTTP